MTFRLICVHIIFSSVWVAEWPPYWKELPTRLTICSLCNLPICNFSFGFEGWIWVLIASVPGLCILFTHKLDRTGKLYMYALHCENTNKIKHTF